MSLFLTNIFSFIKLQNKQVSLRTIGKSVFFSFQEKYNPFFTIYFNKFKFTFHYLHANWWAKSQM